MANMSYCRFHNTLGDLEDCLDVLDGYGETINSKSEKNKAIRMVSLMSQFLIDNDLLHVDKYGNITTNQEDIEEFVSGFCSEDE